MFRRWAAQPFGQFNEEWSNFYRAGLSIEFMIQRLLQFSENRTLHEYWCDGANPVVYEFSGDEFFFSGACTLSDHHAQAMWLVPFELRIAYPPKCEWPLTASIRLGHRDNEQLFDRSLICSRNRRLYLLSHSIYGNRPQEDSGWAITVCLNPYPAKQDG